VRKKSVFHAAMRKKFDNEVTTRALVFEKCEKRNRKRETTGKQHRLAERLGRRRKKIVQVNPRPARTLFVGQDYD